MTKMFNFALKIKGSVVGRVAHVKKIWNVHLIFLL